MKKGLSWFSWLAFFLSAFVIIVGGLILLKTHQNNGLYITYAGYIGLFMSVFLMAIAYGVPEQ